MRVQADRDPPLGSPGGPCRVVDRVRHDVGQPSLRERLEDLVEAGRELSNDQAAAVYDLDVEMGAGLWQRIQIGPHAQYRMDLRGITVADLKVSLARWGKQLLDKKAQKDWEWSYTMTALARGESVEWLDVRSNLFIAISMADVRTVKIVTVYWKGRKDPAAPGDCPSAARVAAAHLAAKEPRSLMPTEVSPRGHSGLPPDQDAEPRRPKPLPNDGLPPGRDKHLPAPVYNVPPASEDAPDGKNLHEDRVRTPGVPGEQYGHPWKDDRVTPTRRASDVEAAGTAPTKQRKQGPDAKTYYKRRRERNKVELDTRAKKWWARNKGHADVRLRREKYRDKPEAYARHPGGPRSNAERSKEWREKQARTAYEIRVRPRRQHRRPAAVRLKARKWYMRNKAQLRMKAKKRYKLIRHLPAFKRHQQLRNQHPELFRRIRACATPVSDGHVPDAIIGFVTLPSMVPGRVLGVLAEGQVTVLVNQWLVRSVQIDRFLARVVFLSDMDLERFMAVADQAILGDGNPVPSPSRVAAMIERQAPAGETEPRVRRLNLLDGDESGRAPATPLDGGHVQGAPGSSRVIPPNSGFVNDSDWMPSRTAAAISEIERRCGPDLVRAAAGLQPRLSRVDQKNGLWTFQVASESKPGTRHVVKIKAVGGAHGAMSVEKADVLLSCDCPAWRWQGPEHWAHVGGWLLGKPRGSATRPATRDPDGRKGLCKHALACLRKARAWDVLVKPQPARVAARWLADGLDRR